MFYSENFIFDGKKSSEYGVILVSSENSVLNEYGTSFESNLISDKSLTSIEEVVFDETLAVGTLAVGIIPPAIIALPPFEFEILILEPFLSYSISERLC